MWGKAATADNDWAYNYLPKLDVAATTCCGLRADDQGKINGYICQGFNPLMSSPNKAKKLTALAKLKFLVVMDPLADRDTRFWENHGEYNDVRPGKDPDRSVPAADHCFAEEDGSLVNSAAGCNGTGRARSRPARRAPTSTSWRELFLRLRELYRTEGGAFPIRSST